MQVFSRAWYRAMTTPNLISALKITGVYPINRYAIDILSTTPKKSFQPEALGKKTGLAFIPLYSPAAPKCSCSSRSSSDQMSSDDDFTIEERTRFRKRFIEGYDILTDKRYNLWLQNFCNSNTSTDLTSSTDLPPASSTSSACLPSPVSSIATSSNLLFGEGIPRVSTLKKILKPPQPEIAKPPNYPRNCGKVLTSAENLKIMQDKERLKSEMLAEKERKRQERERKKERLEEAKKKKRREKERKRRKKWHR